MARCALSHGDKVVATMRRLEAAKGLLAEFPSSQLVAVELDVTKKEQIRPAFMIGKAHFGRIDVVFNNAGYVVGGELETIPDDTARTAFEVNFWGAVHISQEAIRFFREENTPQGGHLIQNSAVCGIMGLPILGMYAASKHGECYLYLYGDGNVYAPLYSPRRVHGLFGFRAAAILEHQGE